MLTVCEVLGVWEAATFDIMVVQVQELGQQFDRGLGTDVDGFHEREYECRQELQHDEWHLVWNIFAYECSRNAPRHPGLPRRGVRVE